MKSISRLVVFCTLSQLPGTALIGQAPSILEPKVERLQGPPMWVSAAAVADEKKGVNLDLVASESLYGDVERQRKILGDRSHAGSWGKGEKPIVTTIPPSDCRSGTFMTSHGEHDDPRGNLADLATYSQMIVRGTIRTIEPGFIFGTPYTLLGVEASESVKGTAPTAPFYVSYPVAHFRIGDFHFCNSTKGFEPQPGDEILLFDYIGPVDREGILYYPQDEQLFFQGKSGILILPSRLKSTPGLEEARSLDEIVARLRSGVVESPEGVR